MKKKSNNFLKVTINQTKIVSSSNIESFTLKLKIMEQNITTDKIGGKVYDYNKSFYFDIPNGKDSVVFELTASSKSYFIFETDIGKLSIPLNLARQKGKNEWYTLKNSSDEIFCMILMSFSYESGVNDLNKSDNSMLDNSKINKYNVSCDNIKVNLNQSRINNSLDVIKGGNQANLTQLTSNNINNLSCFSRINDIQKINDNTIISNNIKSNDLSNINIHSNSFNNQSKPKKYDESNYISTLDSILEANEEGGNEKYGEEYYKEYKRKLLKKLNVYKEEKEKLHKLEEEMKNTKDRLRQKENHLRKEKEVLDENVRNYKNERGFVDSNMKILNQQLNLMTEEETRLYYEKEKFEYERSTFFEINFLVNNTNNLENKIEELSEKFQKCYLISKRPSFKKEEVDLGNATTNNINLNILKQNNSTQNFNLTSKMLEENNNVNTSINKSSSKYLNMIDLENENGRCKHSKSEHHKNIIIVSKNQQIFNSNHSLNSKGKINETEHSHDTTFSAVHKSQSTAIIQSKFYPPIAEINLNGAKGEVVTPPTNYKELVKPKLTDSLDNLTPKKILKNSLKLNRGGSEENKKKDEMPPKDCTKKIIQTVNSSNKKISPKLEIVKKDTSVCAIQNSHFNPSNLVSHRTDKNMGTKINLRKLK